MICPPTQQTGSTFYPQTSKATAERKTFTEKNTIYSFVKLENIIYNIQLFQTHD